MLNYVKMDKETKKEFMGMLDVDDEQESVFDFNITDEERITFGIPEKNEYLTIIDKKTDMAILHLAFLFQRRGELTKSFEYACKLPDSMKVEYMRTVITNK